MRPELHTGSPRRPGRPSRAGAVLLLSAAAGLALATLARETRAQAEPPAEQAVPPTDTYVLLGWNDTGMHCQNESFANFAIQTPGNNLLSQLVRVGPKPRIVTEGVQVDYGIKSNTYSDGKTDFWKFARQLFGIELAPNTGLTGATLAGQMKAAGNHFEILGVPLTPYRDNAPQPGPANWYPYQTARQVARDQATGRALAETTHVAAVSTETRCELCHADGTQQGIATGNVETNVLALHDQKEGTKLVESRPVLCAGCHGSNEGRPGKEGVPSLSRVMHGKHAEIFPDTGHPALPKGAEAPQRLAAGSRPRSAATPAVLEMLSTCYQCHPGRRTQCHRDVMHVAGITCVDCHGTLADLAAPARRSWVDQPRCGDCHAAVYAENEGKRYRDSVGHGGMYCAACHGSPHAILPTVQTNDNLQSISVQGHAGTIRECFVCHGFTPPEGPGPHGLRLTLLTPRPPRSAAATSAGTGPGSPPAGEPSPTPKMP